MNNTVSVTCAVIVKNDTILACQRGPNSEHPYEWEFPGGKIEDGETPEQCIVREIWEELNVDIEIIKPLHEIVFNYPEKSVQLIPFLCSLTKGNPTPIEHHTIRWQLKSRMADLTWSEADEKLICLNSSEFK